MFMKLLTLIRIGEAVAVITVGLSGVGLPPTLTMSHVLAIRMYAGSPGRSAHDLSAENGLVEL